MFRKFFPVVMIVNKQKAFFSITSHTAAQRLHIQQICRTAIWIYWNHFCQFFSKGLAEPKYTLQSVIGFPQITGASDGSLKIIRDHWTVVGISRLCTLLHGGKLTHRIIPSMIHIEAQKIAAVSQRVHRQRKSICCCDPRTAMFTHLNPRP